MSEWQPIETAPEFPTTVDIWLRVYASPRSMGWADEFRITEAYKKDGKWFHTHDSKEMEIYLDYITHWMPLPDPPKIHAEQHVDGR